MDFPSLVGARYILTSIDGFSKRTWVYFLKNKNMVLERFIEFGTLVEKQCGQTMKCLRFHGGGEYVSHVFEGYLSQNGISWHQTVPYSAQ